jgi:amino acid adenylation domain-containing protein
MPFLMTISVQDIYPLTPTQQGMLFHSLSAPGTGLYVVQIAVTLVGKVDEAAEMLAWRALIRRHDVLRTAFAWEKQRAPLQAVGSDAIPHLEIRDLTALDAAAQTEAIDLSISQDRSRGFDLNRAPLLRATRFALAIDRHRLVLSFHHIVIDGWSIPLLLRDWIALYQGRDLPPARPFREHVAWLQSQDPSASLDFWAQELSGIEQSMPLSLPAPSLPESGGGEIRFSLDAKFTHRLSTLARGRRLTMSTIVHGLWALLLSRYSDEDDVLYGLARSGRPAELSEVDNRVGMFLTTLPMRARIEAQRPLIDWLADLQEQQQNQIPYEHVSLVAVQGVTGIAPGTPMMHSVVVFENYPMDMALRSPGQGIALADVEIIEQTSFPVSLFATLRESLDIRIRYDRSLFAAPALARAAEHLQRLFEVLAETPSIKLTDVDILSENERLLLVAMGASAPCEIDCPSLLDRLQRRCERDPQGMAVATATETFDISSISHRANQLARHLLARGARPGQPVGLCLARSADVPVALLAILKAGCHFVPLDPSYPKARLDHFVADSGLSIVICHAATDITAADLGIATINLEVDATQIGSQDSGPLDHRPAPEDCAYLIYTSGSTGTPKGVRIPHRALDNLLTSFATRLASDVDHRWLAVTTLSFDISILEILLPLTTGGLLVLPTDGEVRDPERLATLLKEWAITHMQATPSTWRLMTGAGWAGKSDLTVLCGGESLDAPLARALLAGCRALWNVYGPTETTIWSTALHLEADLINNDRVPIGKPIDNTELHVLDRHGRPAPQGIPGELHIGGAGLSSGYNGRPDLDAERFITILRSTHAGQKSYRLYRTGDLVRYREDGNLDYLGRLDHQAKLRGHRMELGEIEAVLCCYPDVAEVACMILGDNADARLVACLRAREGTVIDETSLRRHAAAALAPIMVPASFHVLHIFPTTLNGKLDRNALAHLVEKTTARENGMPDGTSPAAEPMATLARLWREALRVESIRAQDNFFDLGGHSLLVVPMRDAIRRHLGVTIEVVDIFRFPTLQTLADHIATLSHSGAATAGAPADDARLQARADGQARLRQRFSQIRR